MVLQTDAGGSWANVVGNDDIYHTAASPATTTAKLRAVASGGSAPYTYAWARTGGATTISADQSTSSETTFTRSSGGGVASATFNCTVTDSRGASFSTDAVQVGEVTFDAS